MSTISKKAYADMFGPTVGDRVRLLYFPRLKFNYRPHSTAVVLFNNRLNTM